MQYEIKALRLGGILDQAVNLVKNHFGLLLGVTSVLLVPFALVQGFVQNEVMPPQMPSNPTPEQFSAFFADFNRAMISLMPLMLIQLFIVYPITNAAVIFVIANKYLGKPVTVGSALGHAMRLIGPLLLTSLLYLLAIMGGYLLCFIPGIIFSFWFFLWSHVVVIEGVSGTAALSRSKQLMKGNIGDVFVLAILVFFISLAVGAGVGFIPQVHLKVVASAFAQAIATIFGAAAFVVFYFSCRCKFENFDLTLLAQSIGDEPGEAAFESDAG